MRARYLILPCIGQIAVLWSHIFTRTMHQHIWVHRGRLCIRCQVHYILSFLKQNKTNPARAGLGTEMYFTIGFLRLTRVAAPVTSFSAEISQEKCKSNQHMFAFHLSLSSRNKIQIVSGAMKGTFWYYFQVFLSRQKKVTTCISVEHIQPPSMLTS